MGNLDAVLREVAQHPRPELREPHGQPRCSIPSPDHPGSHWLRLGRRSFAVFDL